MPIFTILSVFIFIGLTRSFVAEDGQYNYEQKVALYTFLSVGMFQMAFFIFLDLLLF